MADFVYVLCAMTSGACALLLLRAYRRSRVRLLFWSLLGFLGLTLNDVFTWVDLRILPPSINLSIVRIVPAVIGMAVLCYGLIWETA